MTDMLAFEAPWKGAPFGGPMANRTPPRREGFAAGRASALPTAALRECYARGARSFGWSRRSPTPRSMRNGRWLVGWGMAAARPHDASQPFGTVFAEVAIDRDLGRIRVPRVAATYDVGRGLHGDGALASLQRGLARGVMIALSEAADRDARVGCFVCTDLLSSDLTPDADAQRLDLAFVGKPDLCAVALDARAIGEIGEAGVLGALFDAVFHATGKRVRDLPFPLDDVLL